ncbi:MAG: glycosyltransferase family 2 protein [Alphaproteobacteria bacterium]|nr:MAG: glycosyltransferase family 2 protein [Alphaproteobacteria bacterium]
MTLACLRSIAAETETAHEIILVDNASTDGSAQAVAKEFPGIRLMAEAENHGFAGANNLAAAEARGQYLLLLNPDTVVRERAIDRLVDFAREMPQAKIWGGRTLFADGSLNPASCWRRIGLWNLFCRAAGLTGLFPGSPVFNSEAYGGWARDSVRAVDIVSGCFLLITRALWQQLGGFDAHFVMYGEEADLCLRARALGADPHITPAATIIHHGGASERVRAEKMIRLLRAKTSLIRRHLPAWQRPAALALIRAWPLSRRLALGLVALSGRKRESAAVWAEIWRRRAEWQQGWSAQGPGPAPQAV